MSIILDALKKSEAERQQGNAPGLYEARMAPPRRRLPAWLVILGILLLINAAAVGWVLLRGSRHEATTPATPPPAMVPAPGRTAAPAVPQSHPQPAPAMAATSSAVTTAVAPADAPASSPAPAPASAADEDAAQAVPPGSPGPRDRETAGDGGTHVHRIGPATAPVPAGPPPPRLPSYDEAAAAGPLPNLTLNLHSWSPVPADRYVLLNMAHLREGETSPQGVKVESITRDGAVLSFQGREFVLPR